MTEIHCPRCHHAPHTTHTHHIDYSTGVVTIAWPNGVITTILKQRHFYSVAEVVTEPLCGRVSLAVWLYAGALLLTLILAVQEVH